MINREFFLQDAEKVAKKLLGCRIVRVVGREVFEGLIVETEAYYDERDPASRACQRGDLRDTMKMVGGTILVYGVHNNWLMNIVTGREGDAQAVLIRAVEPLNFEGDCRGPGKLTKSFLIGKEFHKQDLFKIEDLKIRGGREIREIVESYRVGVKKDLEKPLRFYVKGCEFVSRK